MKNLTVAILLASGLAATPVLAAQPKNLFEALFPKLIEKRIKREAALNPVPVAKVSSAENLHLSS